MKEIIKEKFAEFGFNLSQRQIEQFEIYLNFLLEENEKFNLTAITDKKEVVLKHFIDSVLPQSYIKKGARIVDIGTGAGFPGVPLKIIRDDIEIVLVDSLNKRVVFLEKLKELLSLENCKCVHSRAEDFVKDEREKFDYALSRAVAGLPTLSEYLLPYVKVGGQVIMYKGQKADQELEEGQKAIKVLGGRLNEVVKFEIEELGNRSIILIDKISHCDKKFPRGKNLPKSKPIV